METTNKGAIIYTNENIYIKSECVFLELCRVGYLAMACQLYELSCNNIKHKMDLKNEPKNRMPLLA
jgi:hypothetical protein